MSEYTSYSYDYSPRIAESELAKAAGLTAISALAGVASSVSALFQSIQEKAAALEATRLHAPEAWLGAIESTPLFASAVAQAMPAFADLARCADPQRLARALPELRHVLEGSRQRLLGVEANVLRSHLASALCELGYELRQPRQPRPGQALFRATRSDGTEVAMRLTPEVGRLELDLSGFRGTTCHVERARIMEALRRHGVFLSEQVAQRHGRCEGGELAAQARMARVEQVGTSAPLMNAERA